MYLNTFKCNIKYLYLNYNNNNNARVHYLITCNRAGYTIPTYC